LERVAGAWPEHLVIRLQRRNPETPGPTHFRAANGRLGLWVSQLDEIKAVAAPFEGGLTLGKPWSAKEFLNGGRPESTVPISELMTDTTKEFVEIELPDALTKGDPAILAFEWCNGDRVR
jgi:hypothetical protein